MVAPSPRTVSYTHLDVYKRQTLFSNPHGLDIGAYDNEMYSCARDVALMSAYAMENETFRSIVSKESAQITVTRADGKPQVIDLQSTDRLLGTYEGACGIKTGYTEAAGNSFACLLYTSRCV